MLSWIRNNFHPLWRLRRNRGFRWLQNHADVVVTQRVGAIKQHSYLFRDFNVLIPHKGMHENMGSILLIVLARMQPELFLDIGANLGGYAWTVYNELPDCEIWLFEPDRKNAALLQKTIEASSADRVRLYNCALSNRCGVAEFIVDDASGSAGSLVDQRGSHYNLQDSYALNTSVNVETLTLDSLLASARSRRTFIKIDVEGAETMVLEGGSIILKEQQPVIILEAFNDSALRFLHRFDYMIYDLEEDGNYLAVSPQYMEMLAPIIGGLKTWQTGVISGKSASERL